ncbi:P-type conjugative transfer protein TrbL [Cupriavidus pauculus]|uniref:P-type conjugative transfer protein TrbL n=1 Tax=Cupriavidus pauculus TaxID=82633 RepID=UPI00385778BF
MPRKSLLNTFFLAVALVLTMSMLAPDAMANAVLDGIANNYKDATGGWSSTLSTIAKSLFLKLATIELVWACIWWILEKDDPSGVLISFLRIFMGLMFFWAILLNFDTWIPAIIDGFSKAGQQAGGIGSLTPSTIMDRGLELASKLMKATDDMSLWDGEGGSMLVAAASALVIALAFGVIAGQMLVTLVESYFAISAGVLFLGFAGSRWTTTFAEKYISYTVSVGVKLFVTYLVVAAGQNVTSTWGNMLTPQMEISDMLMIMIGSGIYMFLGWQIPSMASSMLSGSVSMTLGSAMATGATMAAGVAGVAAAGTAVAGKMGAEAIGALRAASAAAGAGNAAGGGAMNALAAAGGSMGSAMGGAMSDGVKGLGKDSIGGKLADRMNERRASMAESAASGAGGDSAAQPQPPAPTGAVSPSAAGGGQGGSASAGASAPTIDTSTSLSQALAERDAGGSVSTAGASPSETPSAASAGSVPDEASGSTHAERASAAAAQPAAPASAAAQNNGPQKQPGAPKKSTREKVADGLATLGNQPNDAAAGAGVQINMKLHD